MVWRGPGRPLFLDIAMLTGLSLFLTLLLGLLPYVSTIKLPPIPSFWAEWVAAVLTGCWLASLRVSAGDRAAFADHGIARAPATSKVVAVPVAVLALAALGVALLLQLLAHMPMFRGAPLLVLCVLALAALVCLAGARLRAAGEAARLLDAWSMALLAALMLNLAAALAERQGLHLYVYQWGWRNPPDRAEGLLGQPNQLAVFAVLASVAAHYLWMRGKLPSIGHVLVALSSAMLIAGSVSRAGALLWIVAAVLSALSLRGHPRRVVGWRLLAIGAVLLVVAQFVWPLLDPPDSHVMKVLRGGARGRIELLRDSWELIRRHPLTGVGYGNFMAARWTELSSSLFEPAANHAHNFVAELGAELGVIAATLVLLPLGWALWRCVIGVTRRGVAPEQFFAATTALVLAGYSLLEYPLWYTFFLLPFALSLGLVEQRDLTVRVSALPRALRWVGWSVAGLLCAVLALDYHRSEDIYSSLELQQREGQGALVRIPLPEVARIASLSAFDLYANLMYSRALAPDGMFMKHKLDVAERAMLSMTNEETIARQIALLVAAGDDAGARSLLARTHRDPDLERNTRGVLGRLAPLHPALTAFVKDLPPLPPPGMENNPAAPSR
jgi:hypothetical protein